MAEVIVIAKATTERVFSKFYLPSHQSAPVNEDFKLKVFS